MKASERKAMFAKKAGRILVTPLESGGHLIALEGGSSGIKLHKTTKPNEDVFIEAEKLRRVARKRLNLE